METDICRFTVARRKIFTHCVVIGGVQVARIFSTIVFTFTLISAPIGAPGVVLAQTPRLTPINSPPILTPLTLTQRDRDRMSQSLVSVQTISLFRDRGVLDERQRERVVTLERDLAAALAARDAVIGNASAAQARLEAARQNFDAEAATLSAANQNLSREIAALRAGVLVRTSTLSDEEVRQRQRFADGDTRALDVMEALKKERLAARRQAAELAMRQEEASEARDSARNFAIAVGRGDPGRTSADVLARWDEAAALDPTDFWQHIERTRLNVTLGSSERAKQAAEQAMQAATTNRDRSAAQHELGNILVAQGDGAGALALYSESLEIARALTVADPRSAAAKRDVSLSLIKVANIKAAQGDGPGALALYSESLEIARALALADPRSAVAKRDVTVSLDKVADIKAAQGDKAGALALYSESLEIARALALADPRSAEAKRDVCVSLIKVAEIKAAQGDGPGALALYSESLEIARAIAAADPRSTAAKRDVSISLEKLANLKAAQGDRPGALLLYQESLDIRRAIAAADLRSAAAKRAVSVSLDGVADIKAAQGDGAAALVLYQESLDIARALATADPRSAQAKRDLGISLARIAELAPTRVRWREAHQHFLAMQRDGLLAPADQRFIAIFQRQADEQDAASPAPAPRAP
jgi:tetratricopeptide (TPR) repeat protein